jgi:hypothetical protein
MFSPQTYPRRLEFSLLCVLALVLSSSGCGAKDTIKLLPVEGTVMLGDKVLATDANTKGTVRLYPDRTKGNDSLQIPRGSIDSEGKFKVLTGVKPGASLGWYRVTVDAATVIDPKNPYHSASGFLVPERYIDKDESDLAFEVVENAPAGAYDLKLNSK